MSALFVSVTAERLFVRARLGWVCCTCRTLFMGQPREGFVCCPLCLSNLNRRGEAK